MLDEKAEDLLHAAYPAPEGVLGRFGRVDILALTSTVLRERLGLRIAEADAETPFELASLLSSCGGQRTDSKVRKDRLARLLQERPGLLPCFVGYQQVAGVGLLPFMTDACRAGGRSSSNQTGG